MLRINLLPSYVQQRRLTRTLIPIFAGLFLLFVAAPLAVYLAMHQKLATLTQQAADAVAGKAKTDSYKAEAATTIAQVAPIQAKLQFVTDVDAYDRQWIALYNTLADTTPKSSLIYTGVAVTGTTMAIKAYSPSVEEVGRYLQVMYHEPDFTSVVVDHIPAYPENVRHLYFLNGVLVFADAATAGGAGAGGAPGGFRGGGAPGGFSGGGPGGQTTTGAPPNFTPEALGPNGAANLPPGVGPPPPEIAVGGTGGAGRMASPGAPSFGGGGGQAGAGQTGTYSENFLRIAGRDISPFAAPTIRDQILQRALRRVVVKTVPKGFDINVTATLKAPLTPPGLPGSAPAAGGPGRGGPPGGFPGGPGGPPPGAMGKPA